MIEVNHITKRFGKVTAVDDFTLDINRGSVLGIVGSNGGGKSTLLRILSGVFDADSGEVKINGQNIYNNPSVKGECFFIPDFPYFSNSATLENTAYLYRSLYPNWNENAFKQFCSVFPIDPDAKIIDMSKGMQRQAALILAISTCPRYLLLDEIFDGLDAVCVAYPLSAIFIKGIVVGCFDGFYVGIFKDSIIMNALNPLAAYDGINIIYWLIFSVACIVLGAFLAKKRKAERAQSAFAFHLPCYIIKVLVSFLAGMFLGVLFASVNVLGGYAGFVFGFILASVPVYIIVHLILYRGFSKLIKTSIPLGALIIVSCVGVALCCFDAFGYNEYVPKVQDVKSAGFYDANSNYQAKGSAVGKNLKDMADDITDKDTIANILEAHYKLVDNRNYSVKNKFKNTWVSMFKDNVPVFSEISKNPDYAFAYTLNNGNIVTRTYSSASAFEETESYLSSSYNELDTSDIIYSKGYIKAYSPLVKADYKDINTFIVAGFDGKATDDKHPDFVSSKIIYIDDDGTVGYSKNYKNTAEKIKEAFLKDLDNCSDEDFAKIDQMTEYADHALDVAYVNYGSYESFIESEPDAVCVIAIATGDVNSYYDGIRNMDSYNGNTAARTQVVYTVPKSFKNTIKALQELGILNSKLYMDKDYLPGDSTSYKEYTGEYYYDDYTSSSDLYDYTDDSYIDDSEY